MFFQTARHTTQSTYYSDWACQGTWVSLAIGFRGKCRVLLMREHSNICHSLVSRVRGVWVVEMLLIHSNRIYICRLVSCHKSRFILMWSKRRLLTPFTFAFDIRMSIDFRNEIEKMDSMTYSFSEDFAPTPKAMFETRKIQANRIRLRTHHKIIIRTYLYIKSNTVLGDICRPRIEVIKTVFARIGPNSRILQHKRCDSHSLRQTHSWLIYLFIHLYMLQLDIASYLVVV